MANGHEVHAVSTRFVEWGTDADVALRGRLKFRWNTVDYSHASGNRLRITSGARFHLCRAIAKKVGPERVPQGLLARATTRVLTEIVRTATTQPADLVYGGGGALMAAALAAQRLRIPYAIDLEDFHQAEQDLSSAEGVFSNQLAQAAEGVVFRGASFLTAASEAIADRYATIYRRRPLVINNTFPLPTSEPEFHSIGTGGLRMYWFSQTVGPGRGLEDAIQAAGLAGIDCELHLLGKPSNGYLNRISSLANDIAPRLKLIHHPPQSPDRMVDLCRPYDVGLSLEQLEPLNRAICLTNKAFTYILAGLPVVFSDTPGQRALADDLGDGALLYTPGDIDTLARGLKRWVDEPALLLAARRAAWAAARRRWHWHHPQEEGTLLRAVDEALR